MLRKYGIMGVHKKSCPSAQDTWLGGYYEVALVLGPCSDVSADERLRKAVAVLWSIPSLQLSAMDHGNRLASKEQIDFETVSLEKIQRLYGCMTHEMFGKIPFTTTAVREMDSADGADWLYAAVPLGGLSDVCPEVGGWPFGNIQNSECWRKPLEDALAKIALEVACSVPFQISVIGFEIAGVIDKEVLEGMLPTERCVGYVTRLDGMYTYLPTTCWG